MDAILRKKGFICDMDGVIYHGSKILDGVADFVKDRADELLSVSDMTFPHTLMRVMTAEQLYRAFTINAGTEYHK
jgi:rRNA large subunit m3Psi methyltransferase RlmH